MKILQITAFTLFMTGYASVQSATSTAKLKISGEPLPAIRHVTDMKVSGDTLLFVFECEDGYGQRLLRRAIIDSASNTINLSPDIGRREDGYYVSYMPYPFITDNGSIRVISQDDSEIYTVANDNGLVRTRQSLIGDSSVPFPLSQYVQDVFMMAPERYVFVGREPKGGRQFAMTADLKTAQIDSLRHITISPERHSWMPNMGEMAYSAAHNRLAFAYRLHPIVEIFGIDGKIICSVRLGEDTFDPQTLDEADFDDLNVLHTVDVSCTHECICILYWGFSYADASTYVPTVIKIDWNGRIIGRYTLNHTPLYRIAARDSSSFIGWTGKDFLLISLTQQ